MRAARVAAAVVAVAVVATGGCGSDSSPSAASPPSPAPDPSASPTTARPNPPPSPEPPEPDRFVTVERLDPDSECDGLVPTGVPAPVTATIDPPGSTGCGGGLSDGTGHLAAIVASTPRGTHYQAFGPNGGARDGFSLTGELWGEPEGWQGVRAASSGPSSSLTLLTFFSDGSPRRSEQPTAGTFGPPSGTVAPDPAGGSLVVLWGPSSAGPDAPCSGEARRYDATGAPTGSAGPTGCGVFAAGVSTAGEALVLEGVAGGARLRWLRSDGTLARPTAEESYRPTGRLVPLLDGSLVALEGGGYTRRYPHLGSAGESAPAWLAARGRQPFRFTRGNKGYAFFPLQGQSSSDCTQVVELVAPRGRTCVKLTFHRDGNACVTGAIDQGWDGTVVQQAASGACQWRFWPGLLGGQGP